MEKEKSRGCYIPNFKHLRVNKVSTSSHLLDFPTLSGRRSFLSRFLFGFPGLLKHCQFGVVLLLQRVPLLPVVQETIQHGGDLHMETAELLMSMRGGQVETNQTTTIY